MGWGAVLLSIVSPRKVGLSLQWAHREVGGTYTSWVSARAPGPTESWGLKGLHQRASGNLEVHQFTPSPAPGSCKESCLSAQESERRPWRGRHHNSDQSQSTHMAHETLSPEFSLRMSRQYIKWVTSFQPENKNNLKGL